MNHGADLVERDQPARAVDADREHQVIAGRGATLNHPANQRQHHCLVGRGVDQPAGADANTQGVDRGASAIGTISRAEQTRKARARIERQIALVNAQGRFGGLAAHNRWPVVKERQVLADVDDGRCAIAIAIGRDQAKRNEIVGTKPRAFGCVGVARSRVHHGALLVERDITRAIHGDRENNRPARAGAADNNTALQRQDDCISSSRVG